DREHELGVDRDCAGPVIGELLEAWCCGSAGPCRDADHTRNGNCKRNNGQPDPHGSLQSLGYPMLPCEPAQGKGMWPSRHDVLAASMGVRAGRKGPAVPREQGCDVVS